jgi:hypothetical protein
VTCCCSRATASRGTLVSRWLVQPASALVPFIMLTIPRMASDLPCGHAYCLPLPCMHGLWRQARLVVHVQVVSATQPVLLACSQAGALFTARHQRQRMAASQAACCWSSTTISGTALGGAAESGVALWPRVPVHCKAASTKLGDH